MSNLGLADANRELYNYLIVTEDRLISMLFHISLVTRKERAITKKKIMVVTTMEHLMSDLLKEKTYEIN